MAGSFRRDERGGTAIEYSLIAGFCSILIASGAINIGAKVVVYFESVLIGFN